MTKNFAKLDAVNKVTNVVVVNDEDCQDASNNYSESTGIDFLKNLTKWDLWSGIHNKNGIAGKGGTYIPEGDYFKPLQPYPSWTFSLSTYKWEAPVAQPEPDTLERQYYWDEEAGEWKFPG